MYFFQVLGNNRSLQMDLNYFFFPKSESFKTVVISLVIREVFIHCFFDIFLSLPF